MIIRENNDLYRYEIHSLVKAFRPGENVKVIVAGDPHAGKALRDDPDIFMDLIFEEELLTIRIHTGVSGAQGPESGEKSPEGGSLLREDDFVRSCPVVHGTVKSRELKDSMKALLYEALSEFTGRQLPWGDLIGIRPTKIAMTQLENGASDDAVREALMREHRVSPEKAQLAVDIAEREKRILSGIHYRNGYSLYIGIPFCPSTCLYCSFTSYPIAAWRSRVDDYLTALERELAETARIMEGSTLDTVYIGGGTPTAIEADQLDRLLDAVGRYYALDTVQEFTVEAGRPDSITREKLLALRRHPVTRISINPQTMKEETLRVIGRGHTAEQVRETYELARESGFDNINMDIILGLPGETGEDVRYTVREIEALNPDSLTVHSLAVKRASRLRRIIDENGYPVFINTDETMRIAQEGAERMGMKPYYLYRQKNMSGNFENVGYAREGKYGIYNILIMEEKQTILAVGAGSITKRVFHQPDGTLRIERCEDAKDIDTYLSCHDEMIGRKRRLFAR